jgi:hypothetical protein
MSLHILRSAIINTHLLNLLTLLVTRHLTVLFLRDCFVALLVFKVNRYVLIRRLLTLHYFTVITLAITSHFTLNQNYLMALNLKRASIEDYSRIKNQ